jgi:hypothetical protein
MVLASAIFMPFTDLSALRIMDKISQTMIEHILPDKLNNFPWLVNY